jgi:hypothetical protein
MGDGIAAIQDDLAKVVDEAGSEWIVLVVHSASGFIGSKAMEGLAAPARRLAVREGGIFKIVFIAAGVALEGADTFGWLLIVE